MDNDETNRIIYHEIVNGTECTANLIQCKECKVNFSKEEICQICQLKLFIKQKFNYDILNEELDLLMEMFTNSTGVIYQEKILG